MESYGRLLARFLEVTPENVARYASVLDAPRLHAGPEQVSPRIYPGTRKAVESLLLLTPRLFQSSPGGEGAERLWRVKYPQRKVVGLASFSGGGGSGPDGQCFHDVFCRLLG